MAYGTTNVDTIQSSTAGTPVVFKDGSGTQIGTLCRAWVNFNGGNGNTAGVINASFNVGSITVNATGDYTVNFTKAMPDANYTVTGTPQLDQGGTSTGLQVIAIGRWTGNPSTTTCRISVQGSGNTAQTSLITTVAFFR